MKSRLQDKTTFYAEPVYRPPSEAYSLLVQATVGCSSAAAGRCFFCGSYVFQKTIPGKRFRIRPTADILTDIAIGYEHYGDNVKKIFLLDSNALIIKTPELLKIVEKCYETFPKLTQVACYGCCDDVLRKSDAELGQLCKAGLNLVFIGLESGDQAVLDLVNKGATVQAQIDSVVKANAAGIRTSVTSIIGLGGRQMYRQHAVNTGKAVSRMNPTFFASLTLMVVPDTPLAVMIKQGKFELVSEPLEIIKELELMIQNIDVPGPVEFRTNHASNYLPLRGSLPQDKATLLAAIQTVLRDPTHLRTESMRGL